MPSRNEGLFHWEFKPMAISDYSTTPGSNTAISSINIAENCPAGGINNAIRQHLADDRDQWNHAEWFEYGDGDGTATVTYVSSTSFKIEGADVSTVWHAGRRVKVVAATPGTIYGTIASVAFSTDTTVTVTWDSGSLSNESLTAYLGILSATNQSIPVGSATAKGTVELATTTETLTGTDATRAVTPDGLAALWEKGSDIASAGTISIGEGGFFHITGTTTITDIDFATDKSGRAAWLIFDGALTLTHNATTLILPTGANITTAAGDACLVVSEDGSDNVRVPIYSRKTGGPVNAVVNSYAKYSYTVASGTDGGGAVVASTWTTLAINTENNDADGIGSLSSNQITLGAGTYRVSARCVFGPQTVGGVGFAVRLLNVTDASTVIVGDHSVGGSTGNIVMTCSLEGEFTLSGSKALAFQYWCNSTSASLGAALSTGISEVYRVIEFTKVA